MDGILISPQKDICVYLLLNSFLAEGTPVFYFAKHFQKKPKKGSNDYVEHSKSKSFR